MSSAQSKPKRPVGVTVIAIIAAAGGVLSVFGGAMVLSGIASGTLLLAYTVMVLGILGLILGYRFFTGPSWAWRTGIVIYLVSIILRVAEIVYGGIVGFLGGVIRVIAGVVIPIFLTRDKPKEFFGKGPAQASPTQARS